MSAQLLSIIVLTFGAGYWTCRVRDFIAWQRGKNRRPDEWQ